MTQIVVNALTFLMLMVFLAFVSPKETAIPVPAAPVTVAPVTPAKHISKDELKCLADNIYHEARGEGFFGMEAVARVTLNRVATEGFPSSICAVVYQPKQFSWTNVGATMQIYEKAAYVQSVAIAKYVLQTGEDITNGSLFFHATYIKKPKWTQSYEQSLVINNHIFYKEKQ